MELASHIVLEYQEKMITAELPILRDFALLLGKKENVVSIVAELNSVSFLLRARKHFNYNNDNLFCAMAKHGNKKLTRFCHDILKANNVAGAMNFAAENGYIDIVRLCHDEWGEKDTYSTLLWASRGGYENIVRLCHKWERNEEYTNIAMENAAYYGYENIVRLCHDEFGATNVNEVMIYAAYKNNRDIICLCLDWGANIDQAIIIAGEELDEELFLKIDDMIKILNEYRNYNVNIIH